MLHASERRLHRLAHVLQSVDLIQLSPFFFLCLSLLGNAIDQTACTTRE